MPTRPDRATLARLLGWGAPWRRSLAQARGRRAARAPGARSAVLLLEEAVPEHDRTAGGLFIWQLMRLLIEAGMPVALFANDRVERQPYVDQLQDLGVDVLGSDVDPRTWIRANDERLRAVIVARPEMGRQYLGAIRSVTAARVVYYTHDLHFVRELRRFDISRDATALREGRRLRGIETRLLNEVDAVITPSPAEVPTIMSLAPGTPVHAVPPFVVARSVEAGPPLSERHELVMVGAFQHLPNEDAAIHLVRDVMPIVWRAVPDAKVQLVGADPPPSVLALADGRVTVRGHVPDLAEVWSHARMSVSPLRFGAGIKGKILTSLEAGVPVVTTSIGNEGIDLVHGQEALIADRPEELAEHVIALFGDADLLERLAIAGRLAVLDRFSKDRARRGLMAALGAADE